MAHRLPAARARHVALPLRAQHGGQRRVVEQQRERGVDAAQALDILAARGTPLFYATNGLTTGAATVYGPYAVKNVEGVYDVYRVTSGT